MRINDINKASTKIKNNINGDKQNDAGSSKIFKREITLLNNENHEKYIISLIDKITIQGQKITN